MSIDSGTKKDNAILISKSYINYILLPGKQSNYNNQPFRYALESGSIQEQLIIIRLLKE